MKAKTCCRGYLGQFAFTAPKASEFGVDLRGRIQSNLPGGVLILTAYKGLSHLLPLLPSKGTDLSLVQDTCCPPYFSIGVSAIAC